MSEILTVTPDEFQEAIPQYVDRAYGLATLIIERALADPTHAIELQATVFNAASPDYRELTSDPVRLAELWKTRDLLRAVEADIPIDNGRLAIEELFLGSSRHLRIWQYMLREQPELRTIDHRRWERLQAAPTEGPAVKWIGSGPREYLGNLATPGYIFARDSPMVGMDSGPLSHMFAYVYASGDALAGQHTHYGAIGIMNIFDQNYRDAIAPPYTRHDAALLDGHNMETYHTAKITRLLAIMGAVAERGV